MSTSRIAGEVWFHCDWPSHCSESLETAEIDFEAAREALIEAGWLTITAGVSFSNYCPYHAAKRLELLEAQAKALMHG